MKKELNWVDLGLVSYEQAFVLQEKIHRHCVAGSFRDTLLFQENPPVITLGRGSHQENLLYSPGELEAMGITISAVNRGGDVSYHGRGQLIVSPILHFETYIGGAHQYVRCLEQVVINVLDHYGLPGKRIKGLSGVWVNDPDTGEERKIAALGIAISHGVTLHGLSLNVDPNLEHFATIIPCGIKDRGVTSIAACGITPPPLTVVRDQFITAFDAMFGTHTTRQTIEAINEI